MPKYVAFLRAINVGGHTVKMDHLRRLFESLGFANVETFIASGNVIFDSRTKSTRLLERKIENHLEEMLGYEVTTFVRTIDEVAQVAAYKPFDEAELNAEGNILYIGFIAGEPTQEANAKFTSLSNEVNGLHVRGREVYWLRRPSLGVSEYEGGKLEKSIAMRATFRNSTTVKKIAAKYAKVL
ncbi:MAG: DUF1697 domain-containing protein [Acidobacteriota bacterium]